MLRLVNPSIARLHASRPFLRPVRGLIIGSRVPLPRKSEPSATLIRSLSSAPTSTIKEVDRKEPNKPEKNVAKSSVFGDYCKLAKVRLSGLVVLTSGGGYVLSGGSVADVFTLVGLCTGTMMCSASASAWNQIVERKHDAIMPRTQNRPMVKGSIPLMHANAFGVGMGLGGVVLLGLTTSTATAALGGFNIFLYTCVYTPLKRVTRFNTEIGALVGAIPPVMGWTAAFGTAGMASPEALVLAATLFTWQMHHFMTIAWKNKDQYAKAGYVMQSLNDPSGSSTVRKGAAWALSMLTLPPIVSGLGITTPHFMITGTAVNLALLWKYYDFYTLRTSTAAFSAMKMGFWQLIALFALLAFHIQDRDNITNFQQLQDLRVVQLFFENKDDICVYLFGNTKGNTVDVAVPTIAVSTKALTNERA